jgi:hypothetical protein
MDTVENLLKSDFLTSGERKLILNYQTVFALQNGPYTLMPRTNLKLDIQKIRLTELLSLISTIFFFQLV